MVVVLFLLGKEEMVLGNFPGQYYLDSYILLYDGVVGQSDRGNYGHSRRSDGTYDTCSRHKYS